MKTRCKPGDRAKIVNAVNHENIGLIVAVVRKYAEGEVIDGFTWSHDGNAWVTLSLSEPVKSSGKDGYSGTRCAVFNDCGLVPLADDDDGITRKASRIKLKRKSASKSTTAPA